MTSVRTVLVVFLLFQGMVALVAQSRNDVLAYIRQFRQSALEQEKNYGIPAPITLAQGILESNAGKSALAQEANNHFGIKADKTWIGPCYYAWDDERQKSRFRKYGSAQESYVDHSVFLKDKDRYSSLFSISKFNYRKWALGLKNAGYATADDYDKRLINIIDRYKLYKINGGAKLKAGKTVTIITKVVTSEIQTDNTDYAMTGSGMSEEEDEDDNIVKINFVIQINDVRCTIMYPGISLDSISNRYNIPTQKILEYNEISNQSSFGEGDIVYLQKKKKKYKGIHDFYIVKPDDTLYTISQRFGIRMANIAKMNNKDLFTKLQEGEKIYLK